MVSWCAVRHYPSSIWKATLSKHVFTLSILSIADIATEFHTQQVVQSMQQFLSSSLGYLCIRYNVTSVPKYKTLQYDSNMQELSFTWAAAYIRFKQKWITSRLITQFELELLLYPHQLLVGITPRLFFTFFSKFEQSPFYPQLKFQQK